MEKIKSFVIKYKYYIIYFLAAVFVMYFTMKQKSIKVKANVDVDLQLDTSSVIDGLYTQPSVDTLTDTLTNEN